MKDLQKLIDKVIDKSVVGCDTYFHENSMWFILTDKKTWIIQLSNSGYLWYNYHFFNKTFKVLSLDVISHQHHITKWVEDTIQNGVKTTTTPFQVYHTNDQVEDTIQNGVKTTGFSAYSNHHQVKDTIQNGVKSTRPIVYILEKMVEDPIQNGVKYTHQRTDSATIGLEDTIQNGIKSN
jgi:hypothetical protein